MSYRSLIISTFGRIMWLAQPACCTEMVIVYAEGGAFVIFYTFFRDILVIAFLDHYHCCYDESKRHQRGGESKHPWKTF